MERDFKEINSDCKILPRVFDVIQELIREEKEGFIIIIIIIFLLIFCPFSCLFLLTNPSIKGDGRKTIVPSTTAF